MLQPDAERALVDAAIAGDTAAVEQLLLGHFSILERHIGPKIPATARRHLAVEDILQDVFAQAFRDIADFDPRSGGSFLAWLKGVADHRLADALKHIRRKKRGGDLHQLTSADAGQSSTLAQLIDLVGHDSGFPSRIVAGDEAAQAIQVAVALLPDDQRDVIRARFFDGLTVDEIAQQTGRTEGAVRGLIHRAKEKLRDAMGRSSRWLSSR